MQLSYRKILDIKCVLAGVNKNYISDSLDINKTVLSREITSSKLIDRIDKLFDTIDPEINIRVKRLVSDDGINILNEPTAPYIKNELAGLKGQIELYKRMDQLQQDEIKRLKNEIDQLKNK